MTKKEKTKEILKRLKKEYPVTVSELIVAPFRDGHIKKMISQAEYPTSEGEDIRFFKSNHAKIFVFTSAVLLAGIFLIDLYLIDFNNFYAGVVPFVLAISISLMYVARKKIMMIILAGLSSAFLLLPLILHSINENHELSLLIAAIVQATIITLVLIWSLYYREDEKKSIVPQWHIPHDLSPLEAGLIYDERFHARDFAAVVLDLVVRGHLTFKENKESRLDSLIGLTKKEDRNLRNYEKKIIDNIFHSFDEMSFDAFFLECSRNNLSEMLSHDHYKELVQKGYYKENPRKTRRSYYLIGITFICLGPVVFPFVTLMYHSFFETLIVFTVSMLALGLFLCTLAPLMVRRTKIGQEIYEYVLGLRVYLELAEKKRIKHEGMPNNKNGLSLKYAPYALALGVESAWSGKYLNVFRTLWSDTDSVNEKFL